MPWSNRSPSSTEPATMNDTESTADLELAETKLQDAVRTRDVDALETLLHDDVRFMGPDGTVIGKEEDLASHRAGAFEISSLDEVSREVRRFGDTGITLVVLDIKGISQEQPITARLAYTRAWKANGPDWQVIAAQGSAIPV